MRDNFRRPAKPEPIEEIEGQLEGRNAIAEALKSGRTVDKVFIASEEAAIRAMEPDADNIWAPAGGEPVIINVKDGAF